MINSAKTIGRVFKCWGELGEDVGKGVWPVWLGVCVCWLLFLGLLHTHWDWETGAPSFFMATFQRGSYSQVFKKDLLCRNFISQRVRGRIYNCKFSKVNVLRNGKPGAYPQIDTYLNLVKLRGNWRLSQSGSNCIILLFLEDFFFLTFLAGLLEMGVLRFLFIWKTISSSLLKHNFTGYKF